MSRLICVIQYNNNFRNAFCEGMSHSMKCRIDKLFFDKNEIVLNTCMDFQGESSDILFIH